MDGIGEVIKQQRKWDAPCFMCARVIPKGSTALRIRWLSDNGLGLFGYFHETCGDRMIQAFKIKSDTKSFPRKGKT